MDAPSTVRVARAPVPFTKALYKMLVDEPESIIYDGGSLVIPNPRALELLLSKYFRHSRYASFQRQLNNFGFHRQNGTAGQTTIYRREGAAEGAPVESILNLRHVLRRSSGGKQNAEAGGRAQEPDGTPRPAKRPRAPRRETAGPARLESENAAVFDASAAAALLQLKSTFAAIPSSA